MIKIVEIKCAYCENSFLTYPSKIKRVKNKFCSKDCHDKFRIKIIKTKCVVCEIEMTYTGADVKRKTCSDECLSLYMSKVSTGKSMVRKEFIITTQGYAAVYIPDHPKAGSRGYVKRMIIKMEEKIGRFLTKEEVVHHIDKNKLNDDPDNLMLFASNSEHIAYHYFVLGDRKINERQRKSKFDKDLIMKLRNTYESGITNISEIARMFDISISSANAIIHKKSKVYDIE